MDHILYTSLISQLNAIGEREEGIACHCCTLQGESAVLDFAFGVVAMVAMTPLITIQALGFKSVVSVRSRDIAAMRRILAAADDQIIYFE